MRLEWLLLLVLSAIQLSPLFYCLYRRRFSLIAVVLSGHFACFSLRGWLGAPLQAQSLGVLLACTLVLMGVWFFFLAPEETSFASAKVSPRTRVALLLGLLLVSYLKSSPVLGFIQLFLTAAIVMSRTPNRWLDLGIVLATLVLGVAAFVRSASLLFLLNMAMFAAATYLGTREKRALAHLVAILACLFALHPVKGKYRQLVWTGAEVSSPLRLAFLTDALQSYSAPSDSPRSLDRLGDDSLDRTLSLTPSRVPYWNGSTYRFLRIFFIPRALWPNKPVRDEWHRFGQLYEVLNPEDKSTSITFNYFAEGYMNYGYWGLTVVLMLLASVLILLDRFLSSLGAGRGLGYVLCSSVLFMPADLTSVLIALGFFCFLLAISFVIPRPLSLGETARATDLPAVD